MLLFYHSSHADSLYLSGGGYVIQRQFRFITAVAVYPILDLEYPRLGLIRVDACDQYNSGAPADYLSSSANSFLTVALAV